MTPYATVAEADTYFAARGLTPQWTAVENKEAALVRGSDYIDQRYRQRLPSGQWVSLFSGQKSGGRGQYREWPRDGAVDYYGEPVPDGVIPDEVKYAAIEAALREGTNPGSLLPDYDPTTAQGAITKERVGPIAVEYADPQGGDSDTSSPNNTTIGGAFLASSNSGSTGLLFAAGAADQGNQTIGTGSTVDVVYTFSASST